jgi:uncharacterized protein (DUF488 family)
MVQPLLTVGHSTRSLDEFLALCRGHGVGRIVDVRRFPGSRRHPHFGREVFERSLVGAGIEYDWRPDLGGRRSRPRSAPPSPWRVPAFAAYADYMRSDEFRRSIRAVLAEAQRVPAAIMCAEAFPYQCHRRLISDWVVLHGTPVVHLLDLTRQEAHRVTDFARADGEDVRYELTQLTLATGTEPPPP